MTGMLISILIVILSAVVGHYLCLKLYKRRDTLSEFDRLFDEAANRMCYTYGSLAEVFNSNFAGFKFDAKEPFASQWYALVQRYSDTLSDDDKRILTEFSTEIGDGDLSAQLKRIRLYQSLIKERQKSASDEVNLKAKLYRAIPFSVGLVIAILII